MNFNVDMTIPVFFEKAEDMDDVRFSKVKVYVAHEGLNQNNTDFSKETLDGMAKTVAGIPIVGYIKQDFLGNIDFSGHELKKVETIDGVEITYLGHAYGFVPENNNARYELKECDDGTEKNYLVVDGILWNKFDDCKNIFDDKSVKSHSMELLPSSVKGMFSKEKIFHVTEASLEALCILGDNVLPGMMNSTIERYTLAPIKEQLKEMLEEFNFSLQTPTTELEHETVGGRETQEIQEEDIKLPKTKLEIATTYSLTANQLSEELYQKVRVKTYSSKNWKGEDVDFSKYYMRDFDENYVYVVDAESGYNDYRLSYQMNGDNAAIDFDSAVKIKYTPTLWEEGDEDTPAENYTLEIVKEARTEYSKLLTEKDSLVGELSAKNNELSQKVDALVELTDKYSLAETALKERDAQIADLTGQVDTLTEYQKSQEGKNREAQVEAILTKYSKHFTEEEVAELQAKHTQFTLVEDFEKEVKMTIADKVINTPSLAPVTNYTRMSIPQTEEKDVGHKNLWDKLEERNK